MKGLDVNDGYSVVGHRTVDAAITEILADHGPALIARGRVLCGCGWQGEKFPPHLAEVVRHGLAERGYRVAKRG